MNCDKKSWNGHHTKKQKIKQFLIKVTPSTMNFPPLSYSYYHLSCKKTKTKTPFSESRKETKKMSMTNSNYFKLPKNNKKQNNLPFLDDTISLFNNHKFFSDKNTRINFKSQKKNDKNKLNSKIIPENCYFRNMIPIAEKLKEYLLLPFNEQKKNNIVKNEMNHNFNKNQKIEMDNINHEAMTNFILRNKENSIKNQYPTFNEIFKNYYNQKFPSEKKIYRVDDNKIVSKNLIYHNYTLIDFKKKKNCESSENSIYKTIKLKKDGDVNSFDQKEKEKEEENLNDAGELITDDQLDKIKPTRFIIDNTKIIGQDKYE